MAKNDLNKKPWLAAILNIIPGLGYLYVGKRTFFGTLLLISSSLFIIDYIINQAAYDAIPFNGWVFVGIFTYFLAFIKDAYNLTKER